MVLWWRWINWVVCCTTTISILSRRDFRFEDKSFQRRRGWCNPDRTGGSIWVDATPWRLFCQWTRVDENPWMWFCWWTQCSERRSICHICWAHYEIKVQEAERPYSESGKWRRVTWYNLHFLNHHLTIYSFVSFMFSMLNMKHLLSFLFKLCFSFISNQSSFL